MKVKNLLFALALGVGSAASALAQQSGASAPPPAAVSGSSSEVISGFANRSLDGMGIKKYLLGPGDVLDLRVYDEPQLSGQLVVNDEGKLEVPFIEEPIPALCRTDLCGAGRLRWARPVLCRCRGRGPARGACSGRRRAWPCRRSGWL